MRWSYVVLPLLIGVVAGGWYWKQLNPTITQVSVVRVEKGDVESTVANTKAGTVKACRRAGLSPSIGGQISELPYAEGSSVKKGALLLKIWSEDIDAEINRAQKAILASMDASEASCLQATASRRTAERSRYLRQSQTISQESYEQSNTQALVNEANCKAQKANIASAYANLRVAETQLKRTRLYAPFAGVIAKINGELNEYVTPSPAGTTGMTVIDLIEPGCFKVTVPIDEVDAPKVNVGMAARVSLDAWRGRVFEASVERLGAYVVDSAKQARTVEVDLTFKDKKDLKDLLVGYSADADIILEIQRDVIRIPAETLVNDHEVLVLNPDTGLLENRVISTGLSNWSFVEITQGLNVGDQLVTSVGQEGVEAGRPAEVMDANQAKTP